MKYDNLVLFDIGGVLLTLDFGRFYKKASEISGSKSPKEFKEAYTRSGIEADFMRGRLRTEEFLAKLRSLINPERES